MAMRDGLIIQPLVHLPIRGTLFGYPWATLEWSHILQIETKHQISCSNRIYQLCYLHEVEMEEHFIFH